MAQPEQSQTQAVSGKSLHPSVVDKLDPAFVKLYNDYIANGASPTTDLHQSRATYSGLYNYATAPATGVGGIGETTVPGWEKYPQEINVRVYVPPGEESGQRKVWPVHFNFHGGGKHPLHCDQNTPSDVLQAGLSETSKPMLTFATTSVPLSHVV